MMRCFPPCFILSLIMKMMETGSQPAWDTKGVRAKSFLNGAKFASVKYVSTHQTCYCSDSCENLACIHTVQHDLIFRHKNLQRVLPTEHCCSAMATSLSVITKHPAEVRLRNNDSSSNIKNANTFFVKSDSCSLFYSPICWFSIQQQKLYSNATCILGLILHLEAECIEGE